MLQAVALCYEWVYLYDFVEGQVQVVEVGQADQILYLGYLIGL